VTQEKGAKPNKGALGRKSLITSSGVVSHCISLSLGLAVEKALPSTYI